MSLIIDKADLDKFKKLGAKTIIDLVLKIPASYEDRTLYSSPDIDVPNVPKGSLLPAKSSSCLIDAEITGFFQSRKIIKLELFSYNFNMKMSGVIFQPKPYHKHQFTLSKRVFLFGKVEHNFSGLQIVQPRVVKETGVIVPIYKTPLRLDSIRALMRQYITLNNLVQEGLPKEVAQTLIELHFPNKIKYSTTQESKLLYALKFAEVYNYIKLLSSKKEFYPAVNSFKADYTPWVDTLPFKLTQDQLSAIKSIQADFTKEHCAKRMIVGDVGSGKTMVILACAYMAGEYGSILMAPTTILAQQLFEEAQKYLPKTMKIALVTNRSKKEDLTDYDFIIGTHALLFRELRKVALVMIDEQHRFGTSQRNRLSKSMQELSVRPHFLQFSATPIPRTQAMINSALLDVSLITQLPFKKDIKTSVIHREDFAKLLKHIKEQIELKHQILIVYPLVEQSEAVEYQSIEESKEFWKNRFKNVYFTYGKDKQKEQVLCEFKDKGDILLATTVVEVGISLPRLTTVIIVGAERLGLSTLHQLRGRVSRTGLKGYCYLYTNLKHSERLSSFAKVHSGFEIAELDLKYRKSGDLLNGTLQSGESFIYLDMAEDENLVLKVKNYFNGRG